MVLFVGVIEIDCMFVEDMVWKMVGLFGIFFVMVVIGWVWIFGGFDVLCYNLYNFVVVNVLFWVIGVFGGFVFVMVIIFILCKKVCLVLIFVYVVLEGFFIGGILVYFEVCWFGIVF